MTHDDIHKRILRRETDREKAALAARLAEVPGLLKELEDKRRTAFDLIKRLDYPRDSRGGLHPSVIDRHGNKVVAWLLVGRYDDGYQTTTIYLTADGDLVNYMEKFDNYPFDHGGNPYTYELVSDDMSRMSPAQVHSSASGICTRLDYMIECLEERLKS